MSTPMDDWLKATAEAVDPQHPGIYPDIAFNGARITVRKISTPLLMSQQMLCDTGQCDHDHSKDPKPKISRWTWLRWWVSDHRPRLHFGSCREEWDE